MIAFVKSTSILLLVFVWTHAFAGQVISWNQFLKREFPNPFSQKM